MIAETTTEMTASSSPAAPQALSMPMQDAVVDPERCWSVYDNEYYKGVHFARHFPTLAEAVAAVTSKDKGIAHLECEKPACVKARHAAIEAERERQRATELAAAASTRAWWLVDRWAGEIGKADGKAGIVVTLQLGLIAATGSGALGADGLLRWAAIAVLLIGVLIAAWAVLPRLPRRPRRTGEGQESEEGAGLNFGVVRGLDAAELAARLHDVDELAAASTEAGDLARITHTKYTAIWWSMLAGVLGLVLAVSASAVGTGVGVR